MKLSLYITKLIRETICKIGRKKTIEIFDIERTTLYKYEKLEDYDACAGIYKAIKKKINSLNN